MKDFQRCKLQVLNVYESQPALKYNFRDLITTSWGTAEKADCLDQF